MKILLDTSVCIAVMRGHAKASAKLRMLEPDDCAISTVAAYELFTGVAKCWEPERERIRVQRLLSTIRVVVFDQAAAEQAAQVRANLERSGKSCGPYDLLLAGHALALGLAFATNNVEEFSRVEGLQVENWLV